MTKLVQVAAAATVAALVTLPLMRFVRWPRLELGPLGWLSLAASAPMIFLLLVAIHEGGHLVAGAMGRFRPCLFIVGPLKLERTDRGWRVGVNHVFPLAGGLVAATPDGIERLRRRMIGLIAGGPSASLLFGIATLAALASMESMWHTALAGPDAVLFLVTLMAGAGSLVLALVALVPGQGHGFSSDGARMLRFLRAGAAVEAEVALLGLVGASMAGQRPRDWDSALVARTLELAPATPTGVAARILAHMQALDRDDIEKARDHLRCALMHAAALPAMSRPSLFLQAAYFEAIHDHHPGLARQRLAEADGGMLISPHSRPMAEGAILVAEGDPRAAAVLALAARQAPRALDRGSAAMAADLIAGMRALVRAGAGDEFGRLT